MRARIFLRRSGAMMPLKTGVTIVAHRQDRGSATLYVTTDDNNLAMAIDLDRRGIDRLLLHLRTIGKVTAADIASDVLRRVFRPAREMLHTPMSLSARQREVLGLLSRGLADKQIGEMLHISEHSVNAHLRRIFRRLEVRSRAAAVARFVRLSPERVTSEVAANARNIFL